MTKKARKRTTKKNAAYYVNNEELTNAIILYKDRVQTAQTRGEPLPQMSDHLGTMILKIATRLSYKANFINYTFRDEMISDAVENCCNYITNFNPEKSSNGFAYITQICYYAFIRRIQKEKKQQMIKFKLLDEAGMPGIYDIFADRHSVHEKDPNKKIVDSIGLSKNDVEKLKNEKATKKKRKRGLEKLMTDGKKDDKDST